MTIVKTNPSSEIVQAYNILNQMIDFKGICKRSLKRPSKYIFSKLDELLRLDLDKLPFTEDMLSSWIEDNSDNLSNPYYRIRLNCDQVKDIRLKAQSTNTSQTTLVTLYLLNVYTIAKAELRN